MTDVLMNAAQPVTVLSMLPLVPLPAHTCALACSAVDMGQKLVRNFGELGAV